MGLKRREFIVNGGKVVFALSVLGAVAAKLFKVPPANEIPPTPESHETLSLLGELPSSSAFETRKELHSNSKGVRFAAISDIHILSSDPAPMKFQTALEDLLTKQDPPLDLIVLNGDLGDGTPEDYEEISQILRTVRISTGKTTPIIPNIGNHEFYKAFHDPVSRAWNSETFPNQETEDLALQRFLTFAERDKVYTDYYINDYHFIFLGSERSRLSDPNIVDAAYLSEKQLTWLKTKISENHSPGKPIFIFLHQPVFSSQSQAKTKYNLVVQQQELAKILQSVANVVLFVGHLHIGLDTPDAYVKDTFHMFNSASVSRVRQKADASQGLVVDVNEGVVKVQGREFITHEWLSEAKYKLNFSK